MSLPLMFSHGGTSSLSQTPHLPLPGEGMIGAFKSVWESHSGTLDSLF